MFWDKASIPLLQFVYCGMVQETFGNVFTSSALALVFTQKMLSLTECELKIEQHQELLFEFNKTNQSHIVSLSALIQCVGGGLNNVSLDLMITINCSSK